MKVICIKKGNWELVKGLFDVDKDPVFGEICTVIEIRKNPLNNGDNYYFLEGYIAGYNINWFAPLSDIDETEMIREYNTQTA